jgi:hypothetical protein
MLNKFFPLLLLLLIMSCGKEVKLDTKKLESYSSITVAESQRAESSGTLIRANSAGAYDRLKSNGREYKISKYSSYLALTYIQKISPGNSVPVIWEGDVVNTEVVLRNLKTP